MSESGRHPILPVQSSAEAAFTFSGNTDVPVPMQHPMLSSRADFERFVPAGSVIDDEASQRYIEAAFKMKSANRVTIEMAQVRLRLMQELADQEDYIFDMEQRYNELVGTNQLGGVLRGWDGLIAPKKSLDTLPKDVRKFYVEAAKQKDHAFSFTSVTSKAYSLRYDLMQQLHHRFSEPSTPSSPTSLTTASSAIPIAHSPMTPQSPQSPSAPSLSGNCSRRRHTVSHLPPSSPDASAASIDISTNWKDSSKNITDQSNDQSLVLSCINSMSYQSQSTKESRIHNNESPHPHNNNTIEDQHSHPIELRTTQDSINSNDHLNLYSKKNKNFFGIYEKTEPCHTKTKNINYVSNTNDQSLTDDILPSISMYSNTTSWTPTLSCHPSPSHTDDDKVLTDSVSETISNSVLLSTTTHNESCSSTVVIGVKRRRQSIPVKSTSVDHERTGPILSSSTLRTVPASSSRSSRKSVNASKRRSTSQAIQKETDSSHDVIDIMSQHYPNEENKRIPLESPTPHSLIQQHIPPTTVPNIQEGGRRSSKKKHLTSAIPKDTTLLHTQTVTKHHRSSI